MDHLEPAEFAGDAAAIGDQGADAALDQRLRTLRFAAVQLGVADGIDTADGLCRPLAHFFDGFVALDGGAETETVNAPGTVDDLFDQLGLEHRSRTVLRESGVAQVIECFGGFNRQYRRTGPVESMSGVGIGDAHAAVFGLRAAGFGPVAAGLFGTC